MAPLTSQENPKIFPQYVQNSYPRPRQQYLCRNTIWFPSSVSPISTLHSLRDPIQTNFLTNPSTFPVVLMALLSHPPSSHKTITLSHFQVVQMKYFPGKIKKVRATRHHQGALESAWSTRGRKESQIQADIWGAAWVWHPHYAPWKMLRGCAYITSYRGRYLPRTPEIIGPWYFLYVFWGKW